jgi:protein-serine/threonine kinase
MMPSYDDDGEDDALAEADRISAQATVRPPAATLPSSLRMLFPDDNPAEPLQPPVMPFAGSRNNTPSPPGPSTAPSPFGTPFSARRFGESDESDEESTKGEDFVFPRGQALFRSRLAANASDTEEEGMPTGSNKSSPMSSPPPLSAEKDVDSGPSSSTATPRNTYREVRTNRGPPDIQIPTDLGSQRQIHLQSPDSMTSPSEPESATSLHMLSSPPFSARSATDRERSQSNAETVTPGTPAAQRDVNLASPAAFQFPAPTKPILPLQLQKSAKTSPTRTLHTATASSPSAHQSTYSLDTPASSRRAPMTPVTRTPSITRTRSATAIPDTTTTRNPYEDLDSSPLIPPVRPFAMKRDRSGSDSGGSIELGTPGLKDVLKVNCT